VDQSEKNPKKTRQVFAGHFGKQYYSWFRLSILQDLGL